MSDDSTARFWLADLVRAGRAVTPDFPSGAGFMKLAGHSDAQWGLFACELPRAAAKAHRIQPADEHVATLIDSAMRYPPALALAREEVEAPTEPPASREKFLRDYSAALLRHLNAQAQAPYVLAECVLDEPGYMLAGHWYWVLRVGDSVTWVSDDYFVYRSPREHFRLTASHLDKLSQLH